MDNYRICTDWYFLKMAFLVSERATCARRKVGCVIVNSKNKMDRRDFTLKLTRELKHKFLVNIVHPRQDKFI